VIGFHDDGDAVAPVFDEAETRLNARKAILEWCFRG
jgi:hypothetical protein